MSKRMYLFLCFLVALVVASIIVVNILNNKYAQKSDFEKEIAGQETRSRAPYVMFRPKPFTHFHCDGADCVNEVNSLGFRSNEISKVKGSNEFRVAMVGGSTVFSGATKDETIVAQLAKVLKEKNPDLMSKEVVYVNAGIPSSVSTQDFVQFVLNLIPLNIDLVVAFNGMNDFYSPFNFDRRAGYPYDYIIEEYRYKKFKEKNWWNTFRSLFDLELMALRAKGLTDIRSYFTALGIDLPEVEQNKERAFEIYFYNMTTLAHIANSYGIKAAIFLQPYNVKPGSDTAYLYERASNEFLSLSKGNSPSRIFYDMSYFGDELHMSDRTSRHVALEMYKLMKIYGMVE
jgi:hypothetical protein